MNSTKTLCAPVAQKERTKGLIMLSMFTAIIFLLAFTPIGLIDLPLIKATILHVPVIIGAILLGPRKGAFLGFVFGLCSLLKNTLAPSLLSFAFSPFMPVPGMDHGSLWALVICFLPRILVGVVPWYVYQGLSAIFRKHSRGGQSVGIAVAAAVGALTNTVLVMGLIFIVFQDAYATIKDIPVDAVLGVILGVVGANGIPEAIVAAVLAPVICLPLLQMLKLERKSPAVEMI